MVIGIALLFAAAFAQGSSEAERAYAIVPLAQPAGLVLEVSGLALLADGRPLVATRRGEVFRVENAYGEREGPPRFTPFAQGLQEPLGLLVDADGSIVAVQRGELSRLLDHDGDGRVDELETICDGWELSGNYHEYNFGPRRDDQGRYWITTNKPFGEEPFGRVDWRGFALRISPDGTLEPMAAGLRSPAGIERAPWGDFFFTDNQGEWCGASKLALLAPGSFHGHPWGVFSCAREEWRFPVPAELPRRVLYPELARRVPTFELPAVWFPYDLMGRSPSGFVWDTGAGTFGPYAGQVFVGDQFQASVLRVFLEQVDGRWQGACFPFRQGLPSGVVRLAWGADGSLLVGMSDRGWPSLGPRPDGLARLVWTGHTPFDLLAVRAVPGGFELEYSAPLAEDTARERRTYGLRSWTYWHSSDYGSPPADELELEVARATLSADRRRVRLEVPRLRAGYVHAIHAPLRAADGRAPIAERAYYTLVALPR